MFINYIKFIEPLDKDSYLNTIPAVQFLVKNTSLYFNTPITFFMGENGTGKSTLIEAIAVASGFSAEGGTRNWYYSTEDSHSELYQHITLGRGDRQKFGFFLRAESFYSMVHFMLENQRKTGLPIENYVEESHGEGFLDIAMNRFKPNGLFILDEPESALSPANQLVLMQRINELVQQNCQFIIASHSPLLTSLPNSEVWEFNESGITLCNFRETYHYLILKRFFSNPEKFLEDNL